MMGKGPTAIFCSLDLLSIIIDLSSPLTTTIAFLDQTLTTENVNLSSHLSTNLVSQTWLGMMDIKVPGH